MGDVMIDAYILVDGANILYRPTPAHRCWESIQTQKNVTVFLNSVDRCCTSGKMWYKALSRDANDNPFGLFINHVDYLKSDDALQTMLAPLLEDTRAVLSYCDMNILAEDGSLMQTIQYQGDFRTDFAHPVNAARALFLFRKDAMASILPHLMKLNMAANWLALQLLSTLGKIVHVPHPFHQFQGHEERMEFQYYMRPEYRLAVQRDYATAREVLSNFLETRKVRYG
jgi:hypothetical protein